jgi:hypothetical protein
MKLEEYFDKFKINKMEFALRCDLSLASIYLYISKKRSPRIEVAKRIEKETGGRVSTDELMRKDGTDNIRDN